MHVDAVAAQGKKKWENLSKLILRPHSADEARFLSGLASVLLAGGTIVVTNPRGGQDTWSKNVPLIKATLDIVSPEVPRLPDGTDYKE